MSSTVPLFLRCSTSIASAVDRLPLPLKDPGAIGLALGSVFVAYICLVRVLRWRRYRNIHRQYEGKWKEGKLTPAEAQRIMAVSSMYDMPLLLNKALSFALFKTYAIPTISKILLATKELGSAKNVARRYADTEILIATWAGCPINGFQDPAKVPTPDSPAEDPRASIALARTNFLHSKYNISNNDYLYTLALFVLEPIVWTDLYGWRRLSPMEQDAFYIFWCDIGKKMGITDIPETLQGLRDWSNAYEEEFMVPAESNRIVAGFTVGELIYGIPKALGLKSFAERIVVALVEERVRIAMMMPEQPRLVHWVAKGILHVNWIVQLLFRLPRSDANLWYSIDPRMPKPDKNGEIRMRPTSEYRSTPWYKPEPTGISYLFNQLAVKLGFYACMPGPQFKSSGYRLEEVGPQAFDGVGLEEVFRNAERIQGCPISAPWRPPSKT